MHVMAFRAGDFAAVRGVRIGLILDGYRCELGISPAVTREAGGGFRCLCHALGVALATCHTRCNMLVNGKTVTGPGCGRRLRKRVNNYGLSEDD
jgi:hypothetical protein